MVNNWFIQGYDAPFIGEKLDPYLYDLESDPELQMTMLQSNRKRIKVVWIWDWNRSVAPKQVHVVAVRAV